MSQEDPAGEALQLKAPIKPPDANSRAMSSQVELLQPLEDSQDSSCITSARDSAAGQSRQGPHPISPGSVNLFTRPAIETAEEIGAGFQYQPPPGRIVPQNPSKTQNFPNTSTLPTGNKSPEGGSSSITLGLLDNGNRQRLHPPTLRIEDVGQPEARPPATSIEIDTASRRDLRDVPDLDTKAPIPSVSDSVPRENASNFPFPDEILDTTKLPHEERRKHRPQYSPLASTELPKFISDTRRKALATMSPRNRVPRRKPSLSSSTSSGHQLPRTEKTSIERDHLESNLRSAVLRPTLNNGETTQDSHLDEAERTSRKHRTGGRQKRKDLIRPVRLESPEYEPVSMMRPCSQASNISKLRAPLKTHHQQRTPTREQNSLNLAKFAKSWNTNYLYNQRLLDRWEQKMVMLEEHIAAKDSAIQQYQQGIESRDQTINDLSAREEELRIQNQKVQDEITASLNTRKKLEEKLRACRNRLNDAINEQQQLFLRCKENCEKATASIQTEGHIQKESIEKATAAVESVRAEVKRKVAAVIDDTNGQIENLNKTIESLETQLIEREKELERERQQSLDLNSQLSEFRKLNEQSIQLVASQNQELLEKMKLDLENSKTRDLLIQNQDAKIDAILKGLEETRLKTADPKVLVEKLEGLHNTTVESIVGTVQNCMNSHQDLNLANWETLKEKLGEIRLVCEGLCERMVNADDVAEWQGRAHDANMTIHTNIQNIQELQAEIHQMYIRSNEELEERERLESRLTSLQDAAANEQAANEKADKLAEEVEQLRGMLNDRDTTIAKSNQDLDAVQEELRAQARILQGKEEQIRNENEQHQKAIELLVQQHKQANFQTASTITKEFEDQYHDTEKRLQEAVTARAQLEHELAELRQEVNVSSQANIDEDLNKIRGELVELITSINGLTTGLQESEHEREDLQRSLEKWIRNRGEVDQMRNLLGRLAKDQPNAVKMSEQLRELLEIQKKLSGTLEYHQAGLANAGIAVGSSESQRNGETSMHPENDSTTVSGLQSDIVYAQEELQNLKRKVVVKSPANDNDLASPISVEEERSTRRQHQPPRGIMKPATRSTSREQEVEGSAVAVDSQRPTAPQPANRRIAKRGSKSLLTTHSLYNRPVAGSISGVSTRQVGANQSGSKESRDDGTDNIAPGVEDYGRIVEVGGDNDEPPLKRHRTNGTLITQKVKVSHSMSTQFSAKKSDNPEPTEEMSSGPKTPLARGGPIERRPSNLVTYGSQGGGMKRPQSKPSDASNEVNLIDGQSTIGSSQTMKLSDSQD